MINPKVQASIILRPLFAIAVAVSQLSSICLGQFGAIDLEKPPLDYTQTEANNRVTKLISRIEKGEVQLEYESERGYLRSLLHYLDISEASQVLVFSKTSMQVQHISPRNPRAIYFNDDTYVGWIRGSSLAEISTNDPKLGAAFYTIRMSAQAPRIRRENYQCLACHATSMTKGVPGHTVRSGYPTYDGHYEPKRESFVTDETSEFRQRWGGWYVTGGHGNLRHMGNTFVRSGILDMTQNGNIQSLEHLFDVDSYLSPYSDIQALMVLEHQTQTHNALTRADFTARVMEHENLDEDTAERSARLQTIAKDVVDRLFYCNEFPLTQSITGNSGFQRDFLKRGPQDSKGRSLREFNMQTRMFQYPLSYLIYSEAFDSLQPALRGEVCRQIKAVLENENSSEEYSHLTPETRSHIHEIVKETKPDILR